MQINLRERAAPQQLEQALLHSVGTVRALRFNKNCDMENFEEQLRKDLHQRLEPGTKEAFNGYVACLHQLYLFGAAMQLKRMGYHMTKMN